MFDDVLSNQRQAMMARRRRRNLPCFAERRRSKRSHPAPFYGPAYSSTKVEEALSEYADRVDVLRYSTLGEACSEAARLIAEGRVLGGIADAWNSSASAWPP